MLDGDLVQSHDTLRIRAVRLRLALHAKASLVRRPPQEKGRVDDDEHAHRNDHNGSIQHEKVDLVRDEVARPSLRQLNGPVDAPNVNHGEAHQHGAQHPPHLPAHGPAQSPTGARDPPQEIRAQHPKDGHGDELERDAGHHDVGALLLLGARVGRRGHGAANGLDDEGDEVAEAKDDSVQLGGEDGGTGTQGEDEAAQEDVEGGREEDGGDDEGHLLGDEGVAVVGALGGVGAGGPADDFGYRLREEDVKLVFSSRSENSKVRTVLVIFCFGGGTYSGRQWRG